MTIYSIIVAAGSGQRMGSPIPKQFLDLQGKPIVCRSVNTFLNTFDDSIVILALASDHFHRREWILNQVDDHTRVRIVQGGENRFLSVRQGLNEVTDPSIVLVHDAVRCLVSPKLLTRCYEEAVISGTAIPCVTSKDSVRLQTPEGNQVVERSRVKLIQTPQAFRSHLLKQAFQQEFRQSFTDEASVVEQMGVKISLIEGEENNIKITTPVDLIIAAEILKQCGNGTK